MDNHDSDGGQAGSVARAPKRRAGGALGADRPQDKKKMRFNSGSDADLDREIFAYEKERSFLQDANANSEDERVLTGFEREESARNAERAARDADREFWRDWRLDSGGNLRPRDYNFVSDKDFVLTDNDRSEDDSLARHDGRQEVADQDRALDEEIAEYGRAQAHREHGGVNSEGERVLAESERDKEVNGSGISVHRTATSRRDQKSVDGYETDDEAASAPTRHDLRVRRRDRVSGR